MVRKIAFPLIALFLAYRSYEILHTLYYVEPDQFGWGMRIFFALLLNLFITGIFAFMGFAYPTHRLLPMPYYRIKNKDAILKWSKFLHLERFRNLLLLFFWGKKKNRRQFFNGKQSGLDHLDYQTKQSEFGHLAAGVCIQVAALSLLVKEHYGIALLSTVLNFISNYYPILLQRNHRIQLERMRKIQARSKGQ